MKADEEAEARNRAVRGGRCRTQALTAGIYCDREIDLRAMILALRGKVFDLPLLFAYALNFWL